MQNARVFVARLVGTSVFDPQGDPVGKVRDVVVLLRSAQAPRVLGLIVEVAARRRIFMPIGRVTAIEPGQVLSTGKVDLQRFQQRSNETLVFGELLDRRVQLLGSGDEVTILDLAIEYQARIREWHATKVFVRASGGGIRRRGENSVVSWDAVTGVSLPVDDQSADNLVQSLEEMHAADVVEVLRDLPMQRRLDVARELDDERLADVLEEMPEDARVELVSLLEDERAADVIEEMDPDDAADLLKEMPAERAAEILDNIDPDDAEDLRRLLTYSDYSAGGMMTTEPVVLTPDATVAEALARLRHDELSPSLAAQVYVVRPPVETPTGRYIGVAHFQRLLREPPSTLIGSVLDTDLVPVRPDAGLQHVARYFATYNLVAVPVVDETNRLLGAVSVDDLAAVEPQDGTQRRRSDAGSKYACGQCVRSAGDLDLVHEARER